jgi:protein gp37
MNKSKIEWCDYTWNPVTGCYHGCKYCYAERIANRFTREYDYQQCKSNDLGKIHDISVPISSETKTLPFPYKFEPTFHRYRLDEPQKIKTPSKIFVSSMGDLFGDWVPDQWIEEVCMSCQKADWHTYLFLTKNPKQYKKIYRSFLDYRFYMWFGATVTDESSFIYKGYDLCHSAGGLRPKKKRANRFLSIEPLQGEIREHILRPCIPEIDWVIVGAQTGSNAVKPKTEWVQKIINECREANVPIFLKDNLNWHEKIQEFPKEMEVKA